MTYLIGVAFVAIIASLGAALFFMMRGGRDTEDEEASASGRSRRMARALAFRVGFSILLFLAVLLAYQLGWIQPSGLPLQR